MKNEFTMTSLMTILSRKISPDFASGALTVIVLVTLAKVVRFFLGRVTLARIQHKANAPVRHVGRDDTITVVGSYDPDHPALHHGISDFSPFCIRVEAYLRWIHQPYVKLSTTTLAENPRHKIPYANIFGEMVDDSTRIIEAIQRKLHIQPDEDKLTVRQKVTGHMIRTVLFEGIYFAFLHGIVATPQGHDMLRQTVQDKVPLPLAIFRSILFQIVWENEHRNTWGQGYGRYPETYIVEKAVQHFESLSITLGDQKFILGTDHATIYDIDLYSFLSCCFLDPTAEHLFAWILPVKRKFPNLVQHTERMKHLLYPELDKEVHGEYLAEEAS